MDHLSFHLKQMLPGDQSRWRLVRGRAKDCSSHEEIAWSDGKLSRKLARHIVGGRELEMG